MDLIEEIQRILSGRLQKPQFDLRYDDQKKVSGYVADEKFKDLDEGQSQKLIWNALRENLGPSELSKILLIYHETPNERSNRMTVSARGKKKMSNYWHHRTPESDRYWVFIDVAQQGNDYKTYYLIINEKTHFKSGTQYSYDEKLIDFMELEPAEIVPELFEKMFALAEEEVKTNLIERYANDKTRVCTAN